MLKSCFRVVVLAIIALSLIASGFLIQPLGTTNKVYGGFGIIEPNTLIAKITSPANGVVFQEGQCFDVTAKISVTCPIFKFTTENEQVQCMIAALDVKATISINGNAQIIGTPTKVVTNILACPEPSGQCPDEATVTWRVCCTGDGMVTINVTPYGEYFCDTNNIADVSGAFYSPDSPVYANPTLSRCPFSGSHLIGDRITVYQQKVVKPFSESSWSNPTQYTWSRPADTRVTTAYLQPSEVLAGQPVKIMANVANRGDISGSLTANLMINGQLEATKKVSVPGNMAVPLEFTVTKDKPGVYEVELNGQKIYFTILGTATVPAYSAPPEPILEKPGSPSNTSNTRTISFAIMGVLILIAMALLIKYLAKR
jgi:hypothetical protein